MPPPKDEDKAVDDFRKAAQKIVEQWRADVEKTLAKVDRVLDEIARIEKLKAPTADDKKKLTLLGAQREAMRKMALDQTKSLEAKMRAIDHLRGVDEKKVAEAEGWLGRSVNLGALAITKNVGIKPKMRFVDRKNGTVMLPFEIRIRF